MLVTLSSKSKTCHQHSSSPTYMQPILAKKRILFKNCDFQVKIWDWFMSKKNLGRIFLGLRKLLLVWKINFARKINYEILFRQLWNFKKKSEVFILTIFDDFAKFHFLRPHFTTNEIKIILKYFSCQKNEEPLKIGWYTIYHKPLVVVSLLRISPQHMVFSDEKGFSGESKWKVFRGFIE